MVDPRPVTRRRLLAAAAIGAAGLGTAAAKLGAVDAVGSPGSEVRGTAQPGTAAGDATRPERTTNETGGDDDSDADRPGTPAIGANLNGRPRRLLNDLELVDASDTSWVRAFIDVRRKLERGTDPENDPDVLALQQVARERDCRLVVSLKWDFRANWGDKPQMRVPEPGSPDERALFQCAAAYLAGVGVPLDVVVLGNEPMWETLAEDVQVEDPPVVRFTRDAKDYLIRTGDHGDPTYLVGAFNRAHDAGIRENHYPQFFRNMFDFVREDDDVDGVDLHVHFDSIGEAEATVAFAREALPEATIVATEFSPVWRYYHNVHTPITDFDACADFAREYDVPPGTSAVEYFEDAKRNPRPPGELADLYEALPWYNVDHVADMYDLFDDYDVALGTFGFTQGLGMRNEDWTEGWNPFHINFLFQPALLRTDDGIEHAANLHYLEDYRERAGSDPDDLP